MPLGPASAGSGSSECCNEGRIAFRRRREDAECGPRRMKSVIGLIQDLIHKVKSLSIPVESETSME